MGAPGLLPGRLQLLRYEENDGRRRGELFFFFFFWRKTFPPRSLLSLLFPSFSASPSPPPLAVHACDCALSRQPYALRAPPLRRSGCAIVLTCPPRKRSHASPVACALSFTPARPCAPAALLPPGPAHGPRTARLCRSRPRPIVSSPPADAAASPHPPPSLAATECQHRVRCARNNTQPEDHIIALRVAGASLEACGRFTRAYTLTHTHTPAARASFAARLHCAVRLTPLSLAFPPAGVVGGLGGLLAFITYVAIGRLPVYLSPCPLSSRHAARVSASASLNLNPLPKPSRTTTALACTRTGSPQYGLSSSSSGASSPPSLRTLWPRPTRRRCVGEKTGGGAKAAVCDYGAARRGALCLPFFLSLSLSLCGCR